MQAYIFQHNLNAFRAYNEFTQNKIILTIIR